MLKKVAAIIGWLIIAAINCIAGELAVEKGSDGSVRDDGDCSCGSVQLQKAVYSGDDSSLCIDGSLPAADRYARLGEEFVGDGLKFLWFEEARR